MNAIAISCCNCGAPLEVGDDTKYVSCTHCNSRLIIERSDNAAHTKIIKQLEEKTNALCVQIRLLKLQRDLDRLETGAVVAQRYRRFQNQQQQECPAVVGLLITVLVCAILATAAIVGGSWGYLIVIGVITILVAFVQIVLHLDEENARRLRERKTQRTRWRRRDRLLAEIGRLQGRDKFHIFIH